MSMTVSDQILQRLHAMGRAPRLWLSGRRHQRPDGRLRPREQADAVRPGAPRGAGGVHGLRARQVHRRGRRLHGDLRARARSTCSTACTTPRLDHQPVVAIVGQQARAALGGDYQQEVDLLSLFKDVAHEYVHIAMVPAQVRHLVDRAMRIARDQRTVTCLIIPNDLQEMDAVEKPPREHGTVHTGIGYDQPARRARTSRPAARGRGAERGPEGGDPGRRRRAARDRRGHRRSPSARRRRRQGAAWQGRGARRSAIRHRLDRPAGHQAELGHDERLRHAADGRLELSLFANSCPRKARRAACRSTSTAACWACATRWRSTWWATASARCRRCCRCCKRKDDRALARRDRGQRAPNGGSVLEARAHERRPPDQSRSACSGSCRPGCPTTAS